VLLAKLCSPEARALCRTAPFKCSTHACMLRFTDSHQQPCLTHWQCQCHHVFTIITKDRLILRLMLESAMTGTSCSAALLGCTHLQSIEYKRGQARPGQARPGQGRAGQGRAGQGRAGQGRAGQGRAGQGRAGQRLTQLGLLLMHGWLQSLSQTEVPKCFQSHAPATGLALPQGDHCATCWAGPIHLLIPAP
jgi:uncharacterized low-complexity protein